MTFRDTLSMAFMNLWRRKLRAFMTVLGMVIGTASIVIMVSLGIGINVSYQESLSEAGSLTKITVSPQNWDKYYQQMESAGGGGIRFYPSPGGSNGPETVDINDKAIEVFRNIQGVTAVTPVLSTYFAYYKSGKFFSNSQLFGIDPKYAEVFGIKLSEGQMFSATGSGSVVEMVVGSQFALGFMNVNTYAAAIDRNGNPRINPMTSRIRLTFDGANIYPWWGGEGNTKPGKMYNVKVTGVIEEGTDWELNYSTFTDVETLRKLMRANKNFIYRDSSSTYDYAWVMAKDVDAVSEIAQQIQDMGYGTSSLGDILKQVQDSSASLRALLGAIGGVALLVAAIGIMNTMMMAIYERTKEIGIIKVLGCRMGDILFMFLSESAYIGFFGGVIGVGVSYGLGAILNNHFLAEMGLRSVIPVWLSLGALTFSVVVSMVSGLYPSIKAMRLSPLAAIRTE
ncbi:MAG: ABC transporter permease [Christensenellales bacterium]|jgi:putative ABC transport system permease protein